MHKVASVFRPLFHNSLGIEFCTFENINDIKITNLPIPELEESSKRIIRAIEDKYGLEHPKAYNGPMFFPTSLEITAETSTLNILGHYYEHGYFLHCILRDKTTDSFVIENELRKYNIMYNAGLAISVVIMTEDGILVFRSHKTCYAGSNQWQMPGGNFQHKNTFISATEEVIEEIGIPKNKLGNTIKPLAFFWKSKYSQITDKKVNPTAVYLLKISRKEIEHYKTELQSNITDDDSAIQVKYLSPIKNIELNESEYTPGVINVISVLQSMEN